MSYSTIDDDAVKREDLEIRIEQLEGQIGEQPTRSTNVSSDSSALSILNAVRSLATSAKIKDLGTLTDTFIIDFQIHDVRELVGNIDKNTTITFANIPAPELLLHLRLYIRSVDPTIIIGGTNIKTTFPAIHPLAVDDFLDIQLKSTDQTNVAVLSVKKNDEDLGSPQAPSFVGNIETSNHAETSFDVSWDQPKTGDTPIVYDIVYSTSPAETAGVPDDLSNIIEDHTTTSISISGLIAGTTYYIWVKAKNTVGESGYNGPVQTNTDGTTNAGDVQFSVTPKVGTFDTITAQFTQPAGKQLKFSLLREIEPSVFIILVRDNIPASGSTFMYDDKFLDPNTAYPYRLEIRNEFGAIIPATPPVADPTVVTTNALSSPTVILVADGARLKFTVTFPAGIISAQAEWSPSSTVDANGNFTDRPVIRSFFRPLGNDPNLSEDVIFFTQVLTPSTLYYGHARLRKGSETGDFSATVNATTANVLPPPQPNITVTSPVVGQIRLKLTFNGSINTDEKIAVSYRLSSSVGEYTELETFSRDEPPVDDLDTRDDRIEVIRSGFTSGQQLTFRAAASNVGGASVEGPDFDTVLID